MRRLLFSTIVVVALTGCSASQLAGTEAPKSTSGGAPSAAATTAVTEASGADVQVVMTYVLPFKSDTGGGGVQIIVAIKNQGGGVAKVGGMDSETWTLYGKDGTVLETGDLTPAPQFLAAGETGYLLGWTNFSGDAQFTQVDKAEPSITFSAADNVPPETIKAEKVVVRPDEYKIWLEATGTVTNVGTEKVSLGTLAIVLFDANGTPLGWLQDSASVMGLLPSQKKGFSTNYGFVPASVASKVKTLGIYTYELAL